MKILIFGGSGGIGLAIIKQLLTQGDNHVVATYHAHCPAYQHPQLEWQALDITNEAQLLSLSATVGSLDWVINCVGVLHDSSHQPEKNLKSIDRDWFLTSIETNALPTLLIAKHFGANLKPSLFAKLAVVSARVGSISDNKLGGWYSYRSSKAALNMLIKGISIEWRRLLPQACVLALHPGTTDTQLSAPFQANVAAGKLFSPEYVADCFIKLIEQSTPEDSGIFLAYDGSVIAW
ncbi:short chain dehydrogenase [Vibrio panuliri]|uniref:Short chain dehydrogenase n=1 Tax=Vibrio panuliri TaxID=1381081 RepID=A0A1Q9HB74_9VIBR|nr:SDR family oxidoreductase [Vibrio panuliri]OLQ86353.1 short chain dehydrogenase [Vibrio panuliri]